MKETTSARTSSEKFREAAGCMSRKLLAAALVLALSIICIGAAGTERAEAAEVKAAEEKAVKKYMTVLELTKLVVKKIGVETDRKSDGTKAFMKKYELTAKDAAYMDTAVNVLGLYTMKEAKRPGTLVTVQLGAAILARADEYLHPQAVKALREEKKEWITPRIDLGTTDSHGWGWNFSQASTLTKTLDFIRDERTSGIDKAPESMQEDILVAYARGLLKGSCKEYSHARTFKLTSKMKASELKAMATMLRDDRKRVPMSPDYQVCRTEGLPETAHRFAYILDSFPNSYYDRGFLGMHATYREGGVNGEWRGAEYFDCPLEDRIGNPDKRRGTHVFIWPSEMDEYKDYPDDMDVCGMDYNERQLTIGNPTVTKECEEYYRHALNVDYRTIEDDKEWQEYMLRFFTKEDLKKYIKSCKKNKTVIECDVVAADVSTMNMSNNGFSCRVYAHMRIVSDTFLDGGREGMMFPVTGTNTDESFDKPTMFSVEGRNMLAWSGYKQTDEWTDFYFSPVLYSNGFEDTSSAWSYSLTRDCTGEYPNLEPCEWW